VYSVINHNKTTVQVQHKHTKNNKMINKISCNSRLLTNRQLANTHNVLRMCGVLLTNKKIKIKIKK